MYYFDLQNPNETLHGEKPVVVEVGPYVYDEYFVKFDIEWTDHGDTVSYNTQKYYIFSPSDSGAGLTEDDTFLLPYPAVLGFQYFLSTIPPEAQAALDYVMLVSHLFLTLHCYFDNFLDSCIAKIVRD